MKTGFILLLVLFCTTSNAENSPPPDPFSVLEKLFALTDAQEVYQGLIELRTESKALEQWLKSAKETYEPDAFYFAVSINILLDDLPLNFEDRPSCSNFLESLLASYRLQDVQDLEDIEQDIVTIYKKTCE